ncbi:MAG TPA: FtsQ-type POTRA domain-containing protein [Actinomycetota bacterium]|nr:FtsQ-type POTRA domain-containing protein [Actinomycetota bacterium]
MKIVKLLAVMVVGALLYQGGRALLESPALRLKHFDVEGNTESRVSTRQVVRASGVEVGDQLVAISTEQVAARLQKLPWVQEARVERILPSTLRISISERMPDLVVETGQGRFLVDRDGLVLQEGSAPLIVLRDLPLNAVVPGVRIGTPEFTSAARILHSLPSDVASRVASVSAPSIDQIRIETRGGPVIYYGAAEQMEEKNYAAETLLKTGSQQAAGIAVIDVRVPSRPSTRAG